MQHVTVFWLNSKLKKWKKTWSSRRQYPYLLYYPTIFLTGQLQNKHWTASWWICPIKYNIYLKQNLLYSVMCITILNYKYKMMIQNLTVISMCYKMKIWVRNWFTKAKITLNRGIGKIRFVLRDVYSLELNMKSPILPRWSVLRKRLANTSSNHVWSPFKTSCFCSEHYSGHGMQKNMAVLNK